MIKDELIAAHPDLAADVFDAFAESKRLYVERLKAGQDREADGGRRGAPAGDGDHRRSAALRHRAQPQVIEELIGHALTQGIITKPVTVDELFAPVDARLVG